MATPRIVQQQLENAEQLLAAQAAQTGKDGPTVVTDASQLLQPQPPVPPTVEAPPAPAPQPPAPPSENWEQKFRTMQGMYNAEVPALKTQVRTFESQVVALTEQVRALTAATAATKTEPPSKPAIDPRDVENFGGDMMDMVQRYVTGALTMLRTEVQSVAEGLDGRLKDLEGRVKGVAETTNTTLEAQFYARLAELVPDWEAVNAQPRWMEWLAEVDPAFGVPRQAALDDAHRRFDAQRVAAIFKQFRAAHPAPQQASVETMVSPPAGGAAAAPASAPAKPLITQKFVQQFYSDVARGRYRDRKEEHDRIEAEINLAAMEGRIV